jgi:hypothetical protein
MGLFLDQLVHHMGDLVALFVALVLGALALSGRVSVNATRVLLFMAWLVALIVIREQSWAIIGWVGGILGFILILYPYALRTRKSAGLMTRKLSVTESQKTAQFFGTSSRRKCRTDRQNSL